MKKQTIAFHIACCVAACLMTACSGNGVPYFADDEPIVPTNYYLRVSPTTLSFDYDDASSRTIQIESNTSWSVKYDADWVSVKTEKAGNDGRITVTVKGNETDGQRTATLEVSSTNASVGSTSVTIKQSAKPAGPGTDITPGGDDNKPPTY